MLFALLMAFVGVLAWRMGVWSSDGPGAGMFSLVSACVGLVCAFLTLASPDAGVPLHDADSDISPMGPSERRTFLVYCGVLVGAVVGAFLFGFLLTIILITLAIVRFGEGRGWRPAILYSIILAVGSDALFGRLLGVDLPQGFLGRAMSTVLGN